MITMLIVRDPLRPRHQRALEVVPWLGQTVGEIVAQWAATKFPAGQSLGVSYDGGPVVPLVEVALLVPEDGASLVVMPDPRGIEVGTLIISLLISTALSLAMRALQPAPQAELRRGEDEQSPTYTWDGAQTAYGEGFRVPLVYGRHLVAGTCIGRQLFEVQNYLFPTAAPVDTFALLLALCEGPIHAIGDQVFPGVVQGTIPEGLRIQDEAAFGDWDSARYRRGDMHQAPIGLWSLVWSVFSADRDLPYEADPSYTYETDGEPVTARLRIKFAGGLYKVSGSSAIAHSVTFKYRYRKTGTTTWSTTYQTTITKCVRTAFVQSVVIEFPEAETYDIQLWRDTPDDGVDAASTATWSQVVEGYPFGGAGTAPAYSGTALLALELAATERLKTVTPNVTVPVSGRLVRWWPWDEITGRGTEQAAVWVETSPACTPGRNPAWVLVDFLTSRRGGLGNFLADANLDLDTIAEWGAWCDELVWDGVTGTHPRAQCDLVLDDGRPAVEAIEAICATGYAHPVWDGSEFTIWWDHARERTQLFATANIRDVAIKWHDTRTRPNVLDVEIRNEEKNWDPDLVSVEDPDAIGRFEPWALGAEPTRRQTIKAHGITRPQHARRLGLYTMARNRAINHTISFTAGIDALAAQVGDRIGVETDVTSFYGARNVGTGERTAYTTVGLRALAAGTAANLITLDQDVVLDAGATYEILITGSDGSPAVRTVTSAAGTYVAGSAIAFSGVAVTWLKAAVVALGRASSVVRDYVITGISLTEDLRREIVAEPYDETIYEIAETMLGPEEEGYGYDADDVLEEGDVPSIEPVTPVLAQPFGPDTRLTWSADPELGTQDVRVYMRSQAGQAWDLVYVGPGSSAVVPRMAPGHGYQVAVMPTQPGSIGFAPTDDAAVDLVGAEFPSEGPPNVGAVEASVIGELVDLSWTPVAYDQLAHYEARYGTQWVGGTVIARTLEPCARRDAPAGTTTVHVRAVSREGVWSPESATVAVTAGYPVGVAEAEEVDVIA
jgi:hypothetical protein